MFKISNVEDTSNELAQMKANVELLNKKFLNNSFNDQTFKNLWVETYDYRQNFIKQHTTSDIMEQFPVYSNAGIVIINFNIFVVRLFF